MNPPRVFLAVRLILITLHQPHPPINPFLNRDHVLFIILSQSARIPGLLICVLFGDLIQILFSQFRSTQCSD